MGKKTLVLGGIRSGKSEYAESCLMDADHVVYMAAAQIFDAEMQERVARHRARRNRLWETIEEPFDLVGALRAVPQKTILLESVGTWISNMLLRYPYDEPVQSPDQRKTIEADIMREIGRLCNAIQNHSGQIYMVSEEVGLSMVSTHPLGRLFEDVLGTANQMLAMRCDDVVLVVAGYPLVIKSAGAHKEQKEGNT